MQLHQASELSILVVLAFIVFASPYISKILRIPLAPAEILLGAVAGYIGVVSDNEMFKLISEVGFFFLMFLAGMEIDLRMLINIDRKILRLGLIYLALIYALATALTLGLELSLLYIIIIPIMAVGMVFTLFKEYGKQQEWLNLSMLIATIGELLSITLLTFTAAYLQFGASINLWLTIGYLILFLAISVLFWWYPGLKVVLMPHYDKDEKDIRLCIAVFFTMIALMLYLNLEVAFGAFIAGMFITTFFDHKKDLPHKLSSFGFGFLVPIFFIHIGSTFKLSSLGSSEVIKDAIFIFLAMLGTRVVSSLLFLGKLGFRGIFLFSVSQSMPLTLLIAVATIAHKSGEISDYSYSSFILASLAQAIIGAIIIKILMQSKSKE